MALLTTIANDLTNTLGPAGVGIGLALNALGIPIPSELLLPVGGVGIRTGKFGVISVMIWSILGQMIGLSLSYLLARYGGVELVERYGKYVGIRRHELEKAQAAFDRYGGRLVFFGLCMPAIHGYVGYPAGIAKMNPGRFVVFALLGSAVWSAVLVYAGYVLGNHLDTLDRLLRQFALVIIVLLVLAIIWYIKRQRRLASTPS